MEEPLWAIVLAGGKGSRLSPLVRRIHSDDRPKQYAVLWGSRSLLEETLDRVALAVSPERTVVVTTRAHEKFFAAGTSKPRAPTYLVQPEDRGTAAGILFPVHWISRRDPAATVVIFPSDHYVSDAAAFARHIRTLVPLAAREADRIILVGARADGPEAGYGWIELGEELAAAEGAGLSRISRFWEKPPPEVARRCYERGCLWNTFIMVGRASAFIDAGRRAVPALHERLARVAPCFGTRAEELAVTCSYASAAKADFSRDVLVPNVDRLVVSPLPAMGWSDCGTPERVLRTFRRKDVQPIWSSRPLGAEESCPEPAIWSPTPPPLAAPQPSP